MGGEIFDSSENSNSTQIHSKTRTFFLILKQPSVKKKASEKYFERKKTKGHSSFFHSSWRKNHEHLKNWRLPHHKKKAVINLRVKSAFETVNINEKKVYDKQMKKTIVLVDLFFPFFIGKHAKERS